MRNHVLVKIDLENRHSFSIVVFQVFVERILYLFHEGEGAAHKSFKKVYSRIFHSYFWFVMKQDINLYVFSCSIGDRFRASRKNRKNPLNLIKIGNRGEVLAMDLMGGKETLHHHAARTSLCSCND